MADDCYKCGGIDMKIYSVSIGIVRNFREERVEIQFTDDSMANACQSAARWAKRAVKVRNEFKEEGEPDYILGSMKFGRWYPTAIDKDGCCTTGPAYIFEWKYDWPSTLDQEVEIKSQKYRLTHDLKDIV